MVLFIMLYKEVLLIPESECRHFLKKRCCIGVKVFVGGISLQMMNRTINLVILNAVQPFKARIQKGSSFLLSYLSLTEVCCRGIQKSCHIVKGNDKTLERN